ncbi:tyrosine-protein kinase Srms [Tursiops truncatus]|uniref:Tyrosine-protein kinase Srms n=1 Tax=Tursiops truncatus TaxID=9739 RepID=A0A6J3Q2Q7_TURTR|nr:tyrosine-protein kinase Srms [Tursiops truncatus]
MEPFFRKLLTFLSFFWDKIWPAGAPRFPNPDSDADVEPEPAAAEPPTAEPCNPPGPRAALQGADFTARSAEDLSVSRGERLHALREEGGYILARRLAGWPSTGLVPITYVANKAAPETLWNQPIKDLNGTSLKRMHHSAQGKFFNVISYKRNGIKTRMG